MSYKIDLFNRAEKALTEIESGDSELRTGITLWVRSDRHPHAAPYIKRSFQEARDCLAVGILLCPYEIKEVGIAYRKTWGDECIQYKIYPNAHNDIVRRLK
jgi:hypothetical protein